MSPAKKRYQREAYKLLQAEIHMAVRDQVWLPAVPNSISTVHS